MTATNIEWADAVWNPVTGCSKISQGCKHCYAEAVAKRFWKDRKFTDVRIHSERLEQPLHWKRPRRVFVNSMSDLFHVDVPELFILETLAIMALTPHITYLVLTKRPEQARQILGQDKDWAEVLGDAAFLATHNDEAECFVANAISGASKPRGGPMGWPLPNLWLGVSVEDQATADERIPLLLQTPAAVRFVSAEPLLGPLNLTHCGEIDGHPLCCLDCHPLVQDQEKCIGIDWVIVGGESGPGARPCNVEWIRSIVRQCKEAAVPCFVKQLGAMSVTADAETSSEFNHCGVRLRLHPVLHPWFARMMFKHPKGADPAEWPEDLQVRQWLEAKI